MPVVWQRRVRGPARVEGAAMVAQLDLERALVIGVASSALFDLEESDAVFR